MILPAGFFAPAFLGSDCFWRRCPSSVPLHLSISGLEGCIFNFFTCLFVFVLVLLVFTSVILKLNIEIFWRSQKVYIFALQADPIITSVKVSLDILSGVSILTS